MTSVSLGIAYFGASYENGTELDREIHSFGRAGTGPIALLLGTMTGWLGRQIQAKRPDAASPSSSPVDSDSNRPAQQPQALAKDVEAAEARRPLSAPETSLLDAQSGESREAPATPISVTEYHANKSIKTIGSQLGEDGPAVGPWQYFRDDGSLHQSGTYDSLGNESITGTWTVLDDSGLRVLYEDGQEIGAFNRYDQAGNLIRSESNE
jgi:hypothetical protein